MRKEDLKIGDQVLTRYGYIGIIKSFSPRYIFLNNGHKNIKIHHSEIIKKYNNGGREIEKSKELDHGFDRLPPGPRQFDGNKRLKRGRENRNFGESG